MEKEEVISEEEAQALRESDDVAADPAAQPMREGEVRDLHPDHWERIIADQVPALESISERMVSLLKTTGRKYFQETVDISVVPSIAYRWGDYARKLPVPTSLNVLHINPTDMKGVICLQPDFVFALVDVFFGGTGNGARETANPEFTPMENCLVRQFVEQIANDMQEAWKPFGNLQFSIGASETNPVFASVAGGSEPVSVAGFEFHIGEKQYQLQTVLPTSIVEPLRFLQDAGQVQGSDAESKRWRSHLGKEVREARVTLRAVLAKTQINLREINSAQPGDIIPMETPSNITVFAGNEPVLEGTFGVRNGRNAVRVNRLMNSRMAGEANG